MADASEQKIAAQQVANIYQHTYTLALGHPFAGALFVWIFRNTIEHFILFVWLTALVVVALIRIPIYQRYLRDPQLHQRTEFWHRVFLIITSCQGLIYGVAWLVFIPVDNPIYAVIVGLWVVGLTGAAAVGYASDMRALTAFCIPVIVPAMIVLLVAGGTLNLALFLTLVLYSTVVLKTVIPVNRSILSAISLNLRLQQEIEQRQNIEGQLRELSLKDELTDLDNRRSFDSHLQQELNRAERTGSPVSLLMIDVDSFKRFNDHYGHIAGDTCLQRIAEVLQRSVRRAGEVAARYGGEEFAVILPSVTAPHAYVVAEAIRTAVQALRVDHHYTEVAGANVVTVSIGIMTAVPDKECDLKEFIGKADTALYQAKAAGRNTIKQA